VITDDALWECAFPDIPAGKYYRITVEFGTVEGNYITLIDPLELIELWRNEGGYVHAMTFHLWKNIDRIWWEERTMP
jgi:hypothetical protein